MIGPIHMTSYHWSLSSPSQTICTHAPACCFLIHNGFKRLGARLDLPEGCSVMIGSWGKDKYRDWLFWWVGSVRQHS